MECNHVVLDLCSYNELMEKARMGEKLLKEIFDAVSAIPSYSDEKILEVKVSWPATIRNIIEDGVLRDHPGAKVDLDTLEYSSWWEGAHLPEVETKTQSEKEDEPTEPGDVLDSASTEAFV